MDTHTLPRIRPSDDDREDTISIRSDDKKHRVLELSATQHVGGALAAATAAALGSRLGLAGTITGATVASILTALASAIYTVSLRRGRDRVKAAVAGVRVRAGDSVIDTPRKTGQSVRVAGPREPRKPKRRIGRRPRLRVVLLGAGAIFVTALAGITGFELVAGHALSGGGATTVQQLGGEQSSTTTKPSTTTPSTQPTATATSTVTATPTATVTITATPTVSGTSATPSPSATSSSGVTPSTSALPSATPSAAATP